MSTLNTLARDYLSTYWGTIRAFPPSFRQLYARIMHEFRAEPDTTSYDQINTREGLEDPSLRGVAHRMYWWFPTHFFKFQDALIRWEENWQSDNKNFILNKPQITFLDLGCGAGAASVALLSVLEQYQVYLSQKGIRSVPILVNLVALDPCQAELVIYERVLTEYLKKLKKSNICVNIKTICQPFPQGKANIVDALALLSGNTLIVGMSNLINWIWNEADIYWIADTSNKIDEIQSEEVEALREIALNSMFDMLYVVGIATKNRKRWWLVEKLSILIQKLEKNLSFSQHPYNLIWRVDAEVLFENPEGSRWAKDKAQGTSRYFVENIADFDPEFFTDSKLHNTVSIESIEKAWIKAQNHISYEAFVDRVELKLFETNYQFEIEMIAQICTEELFQYLNVELDFPYLFPKNNETDRPKSSSRLEEQIIATAIILMFQDELSGSCPRVSFSHQLAQENSEFLYEYWFQLYSKYVTKTLENIGNEQVCTSDIKSYYPNINQSILLGILSHRLRASQRCYEILKRIVKRDCHFTHKNGYGISQGHVISGVLANVMLQPVDERLVYDNKLEDRYFRFADDVTFTGVNSTEDAENVDELILLKRILRKHDQELKLNKSKTIKYETPQEFRAKVGGKREFDEISARFRKLLLPLFVMDRAHRSEFSRINWHFVYEYQKLLEDIGIYFSPEWLYRKLDEYTRPRKLIASIYRIVRGRYAITYPNLSLNSSRQGRIKWAELFRNENSNWISEKENLGIRLSLMFQSSARELISETQSDVSIHSRRIKFSLYRLSVFGVGDVADQITVLLTTQPWNIPVWLSCRGLARAGLETALYHVIDESMSSYVRANALKALGDLRTPECVEILANTLDSDSDFIEKLMASEALLEANLWRNIPETRIKNWLEQTSDQPYLFKNVLLVLGQSSPQTFDEYVSSLNFADLHPIILRAIYYAKTKSPTENILWRPEPEVIRNYRAKSYPIIEELLQDEGSYKFVSRQ